MALLEVHNITMKFGELLAIDNVSFNIEVNTIVGLIGPNGAGKTTLFNCISGIYRPNSGKIIFDQTNITELSAYNVARLGAVRTFQVVRPLKEMSVFDNVLVGAFLKNKNTTKAFGIASKSIEICNLKDNQNKKAGDLTIGDKKRLELACALATSPKLLMLDEIMAGLTTTEIKVAIEIIKNIQQNGTTLLVVEHVMEAIMPIADKIVVLDSGVKIVEGAPQEIITNETVMTAYLGKKFATRLKKAREINRNG
ncbi:MAG: ABC transporter ATP-binding protein [Anaerolinea sp. 4484_236]|nr:MAG: ABC transporter ATP-binding protein [Anaerolinea sp. 4484_236]